MMGSQEEQDSNQDYLARCKVTESDPVVLLDWHIDTLQRFVDHANQQLILPQGFFVTTAPGHMTVTSFVTDVVNMLSQVSGGRNGNTLLAPNTLNQAMNIIQVLEDIQRDDWMQQDFAQSVPAGSFLATVYHIIDRRISSATPIGLVPPQVQGVRQIFR
jgi:hypothetical protein